MTKEELEKEAEDKGIEYADSIEYTILKRIAELEVTNKKISNECHKLVDSLEKKQNENELLETQNIKLQAEVSRLTIKNAELKSSECWKSCEYANPKAELIGQHIKDVQNLTKAKEIIRTLLLVADNKASQMEFQLCVADAKQFLNSEVEK